MLTNEFLLITNWGGKSSADGFLLVPVLTNQDTVLEIAVQNVSPTAVARDIDITAMLPPNWEITASPEWRFSRSGSRTISDINGELQTNSYKEIGYISPRDFALLAGKTLVAPAIVVHGTPTDAQMVALIARCQGSDASGVGFFMRFLPLESNSPAWHMMAKPFVALSHTNDRGGSTIAISKDELEKLQK
jgi:hypothetical protein